MAYKPSTSSWKKITKTYADFAAAGLTNNITVYTLAAGEAVHAAYIKHSASFAGGLIATYTLSLGIAGTLAKYIAASNVLQAPGAAVMGVPLAIVPTVETFGATTDVKAAAISTVGNLDTATAGTVDIYILTSKIL